MPSSGSLEREIERAMPGDRQRLRKELPRWARREERGRGDPAGGRMARWTGELKRSIALRHTRTTCVPAIRFDEDCPSRPRRDEIAAAIREHQVVIVCGETGSGKSTQLPKICLELGRGIDGLIGHTQPRRIAARSHRRPHRRGAGLAAGTRRGLQDPLRRDHQPAELHQADDRRHPAGRDPERPAARPVRHDHPGRGPRAVAEHRFPDRAPEAAPAAAAGPEGDHHLGHDRRRPLRRALCRTPLGRHGHR